MATQIKKEKELIVKLAARAGVVIDGTEPWDIKVHNEDFYPRVFRELYLGLGESYMDGWWDCKQLDEFFFKTIRADLEDELKTWRLAVHFFKGQIFNYQKRSKAAEVAHKH